MNLTPDSSFAAVVVLLGFVHYLETLLEYALADAALIAQLEGLAP